MIFTNEMQQFEDELYILKIRRVQFEDKYTKQLESNYMNDLENIFNCIEQLNRKIHNLEIKYRNLYIEENCSNM